MSPGRKRTRLLIAVLCCGVALHPATGLSPQGAAPPAPPAAKPADSGLTSDELIQRAIEALDRVITSREDRERQTALAAAARDAETLKAKDPANEWNGYLNGRILAYSGRPMEAIAFLKDFSATRVGSTYWPVFRSLGDVFVEEWPIQARSMYRKADELKPNESAVLLGLSMCAVKVGDGKHAVEWAEKAVAAAGEEDRARLLGHLAQMQAADGQAETAYRTAVQAVERAEVQLRANPGSRSALQLAERHCLLVLNGIRTLLSEQTADPSWYERLAETLERLSDIRHRLSLLDTLAAVETGISLSGARAPTTLYVRRAQLLERLGLMDRARGAYEDLLKKDPQNEDATRFLKANPKVPDS
jgi:tetratricopeptide (TPR) repeat protein